MSSFSGGRAFCLLLLCCVLSGCWLKPIYGPVSENERPIQAELATIAVRAPEGELAHLLRDELSNDLNPAGMVGSPRDYYLEVTPREFTNALLIQLDDSISRFDLTVAVEFTLINAADNSTAYRSAVRRVASYNVIDDTYATLVARRDARRRASIEASRAITTLIAGYFRERET